MIFTSDFLFEMGLSVEDMKDYREYLSRSASSKESFNVQYRAAVLKDRMEEVVKVYENQFIDIFRCAGCRFIIFEKDIEGYYKINVKSFVVKPDTLHHDCEKASISGWKFSKP